MSKEPTRATIKKLFALSGNQCAFPRCKTLLVDRALPTVVAHVCHITAANPEGPRYDPSMMDRERASFDNLILMCPTHHTVIDSDLVTYTVERLNQVKYGHEGKYQVPETLSDAEADQLIHTMRVNGPIVLQSDNRGGQIAQSITNIYAIEKNPPTRTLRGAVEECFIACRPAHLTSPHFGWLGFARLRLWVDGPPTGLADIQVQLSDPFNPTVMNVAGPMSSAHLGCSWPTEVLGDQTGLLAATQNRLLQLGGKADPTEGWLQFRCSSDYELGPRLYWSPSNAKLVLRFREHGGYTGWRLTCRFVDEVAVSEVDAPFERRLWNPRRLIPRESQPIDVDCDW